jgi:hypothetical protein
MTLVWSPQVGAQHSLSTCPIEEVFFGGARGGGKTDGILGKWALREKRLGPHFNAIGLRPTAKSWDDAWNRSKQIFGPLGGKPNEQRLTWKMPHGGRCQFSFLDRVDDADNYQGKNITDVWIEEAGLYSTTVGPEHLPRPIARMKGVMRAPIGIRTQMILTGNPGGPGQHWIATRYGMIPFPTRPKVVTVRSEDGLETMAAVIPSRVEDNHMIDQAAYVRQLRQSGSGALVSAWLRGDWTAVEGAFFDCWDARRHVIEPFKIPPEWLRFVSMDWGFASPASIGWWTVVGDEVKIRPDLVLPRGCMVRYREWYVRGRLTATQVAEGILEREIMANETRDGDRFSQYGTPGIAYGVLDPSAFAEDGGPSFAEQMAKAGVLFRRADNKRIREVGAMSGWMQMRDRLVGLAPDRPMVVAFTSCVDSIRTIPVLQHDPDWPEDLDTTAEDHAADDWRYGCMSRPWTRELPKSSTGRTLTVTEGGRAPATQVTLDDLWEHERKMREERI